MAAVTFGTIRATSDNCRSANNARGQDLYGKPKRTNVIFVP